MISNYFEDVKAAKAKYADAWLHAHVEGDPRRLEWIKLFAKDLRAKDPKVGANGKRGNKIDLSADAINILCAAADSAGRTPEGLPCVVVDVIGSAGARPPYTPSNREPYPVWNVYDTFVEGSGANVDPHSTPIPAPSPVKPYPGDPVWDAVGEALFADYALAKQAPNPQMGRWFGRTIWDATEGDETGKVWTVPDSIKEHRGEWRGELPKPPNGWPPL